MSVDLLRQQPRWKEALVSLREMMTSLIQQVHSCKFCSYMNALFIKCVLTSLHISIKKGFKSDNMKTWKMHWDRQLYKALEHQYQMGLEALNENLPEIKVELVFRYGNMICFLVVYM